MALALADLSTRLPVACTYRSVTRSEGRFTLAERASRLVVALRAHPAALRSRGSIHEPESADPEGRMLANAQVGQLAESVRVVQGREEPTLVEPGRLDKSELLGLGFIVSTSAEAADSAVVNVIA